VIDFITPTVAISNCLEARWLVAHNRLPVDAALEQVAATREINVAPELLTLVARLEA